jgi:uncharacterized protein
MKRLSHWIACLLALFPSTSFGLVDASYRREVEIWRKEREERLKKEDGWLSLVGLAWLKEGRNSAGTSSAAAVRVPAGTVPMTSDFGAFEVHSGTVRFVPAAGLRYELNGKPGTEAVSLQSDENEKPDLLQVGRLRMMLIKRTQGLGIRMRDNEAPTRNHFKGLAWYPVQEKFRIKAKFLPFPEPKKLTIPDVLGGTQEATSSGEVTFILDHKPLKLIAFDEKDKLFILFKDRSNESDTYPAGRFLYAGKPGADNVVELDLNKAFTPPCGFSKFATCPLPPRENFLKAAVPAGERYLDRSAH